MKFFEWLMAIYWSMTTPPLPPRPPASQPRIPPLGDPELVNRLLISHNTARTAAGLHALEHNSDLTQAARWHAHWMANQGILSHKETPGTTGFTGVSLADRLRPGVGSSITYRLGAGGENIALGQPDTDAVMRSWMNSSGHRANIVNRNYVHAGFHAAADTRGRIYWCAVYGAPLRTRQWRVKVNLSGPLTSR